MPEVEQVEALVVVAVVAQTAAALVLLLVDTVLVVGCWGEDQVEVHGMVGQRVLVEQR